MRAYVQFHGWGDRFPMLHESITNILAVEIALLVGHQPSVALI
jgi:hypothetical protein